MERNELCWCGSGKKYKKCHMPIEEKILLHSERGEIVPTRAILKTAEQIEKIKESARLNTAVLDEVAKHIRIGMTKKAFFPGNVYSSKDQISAFCQFMYIISHSYSYQTIPHCLS